MNTPACDTQVFIDTTPAELLHIPANQINLKVLADIPVSDSADIQVD
jgi:hypothetical protein